MKNFIRLTISLTMALALASCDRVRESTATFYVAATFEITDAEYDAIAVDSLLYVPKFYWEQVAYIATQCGGDNKGYVGGFKISNKIGSPEDTDAQAIFTSASPNSGALNSRYYTGFYDTGMTPTYDIAYELGGYSSALNYLMGCYVVNSEYNKRLYDAGEIEQGDYLKVVARAYKNNSLVTIAEKKLIDFTGAEHVFINEWEAWEMNLVGTDHQVFDFDSISFSVEATGKLLPCFCMDNFTSQLSVVY